MEILAYGEDALTLWALQNKLPDFLRHFGDVSLKDDCKVLFRPSFGRRGGDESAQFGEFDFILLSPACIYLGESKWDRSSEVGRNGLITLRSEQELRHTLFRAYVEEWFAGQYSTWDAFRPHAQAGLIARNIAKPVPSAERTLALNLKSVLEFIRQQYADLPAIKDVLLYMHKGQLNDPPPQVSPATFCFFPVEYTPYPNDQFIRINL